MRYMKNMMILLLAALAASFYALIVGVLMHKKIRSVLAYVKIAKN